MARLGRFGDHLYVRAGNVFEECHQVEFLLIVGPQAHACLLADNGHHRHVVFARIVEAVEQMDRTGAGGRHANTDFIAELGVGASHEGGDFFVARLDQARGTIGAAQGGHDAIDAITRVAVEAFDAPLVQTGHNKIRDGSCHDRSLIAGTG